MNSKFKKISWQCDSLRDLTFGKPMNSQVPKTSDAGCSAMLLLKIVVIIHESNQQY